MYIHIIYTSIIIPPKRTYMMFGLSAEAAKQNAGNGKEQV